jgi:single-stranded-DNA-specific exonuclease
MVLAVDAAGQQRIDAIAFNIDVKQWPNSQVDQIAVVYKLDVNEFIGQQSLQLLVDDFEPAVIVS